MNGGVLIMLVLYEIILVNMNMLCFEVLCVNEQVLIIKDCMCVDVQVEFFVCVQLMIEFIVNVVQILGKCIMDLEVLKVLVEGKFVDVLCVVVVEMVMEELYE